VSGGHPRPPRTAIVVGGGIVGAACAASLAEAGVAVQVIEAGRIASGATAAGMGHILVLDDSEAQLALTRLGRSLWDDLRDVFPDAVERDPCGTMWVAADEEELEAARQRHAFYAERGIPSEVVDAAGLYRHEPNLRPGFVGGLRIVEDSVVYPPTATAHLLDTARRHGAQVFEQTPVTRCEDGVVQLADGARREADVVIVAAGIATPRLVDLPGLVIQPKKGHLAITSRCPGFIHHQLVELGYLKSAHGGERTSVAFNVQPRATGQILIGSSRQLDTDDPVVEPEILARMLTRAIEFLPGLADLPILRTWAGFRPATPDNLPVVGPVPGSPGLWVASGHEGVGITTSLSSAHILADRLLGRTPPIDPTPFDTQRLAHGTSHGAAHG
jgi:glycine/D-amino acid oxidase-like deaminating enzyme